MTWAGHSFYYMWFLDYYMGYSDLLFTDLYWHCMFMCTYALDTVFYACISVQNFQYMCTYLISVLLLILGFSFILLLNTCTRMSEPHHLIIYTYDCLSMPTGFILRTRWVAFWKPWRLMSRSRSLDRGGLVVTDQSAQWKCRLVVVCVDLLFFQPLWSACKILILLIVSIFQSFYIAYHALRFLVI